MISVKRNGNVTMFRIRSFAYQLFLFLFGFERQWANIKLQHTGESEFCFIVIFVSQRQKKNVKSFFFLIGDFRSWWNVTIYGMECTTRTLSSSLKIYWDLYESLMICNKHKNYAIFFGGEGGSVFREENIIWLFGWIHNL